MSARHTKTRPNMAMSPRSRVAVDPRTGKIVLLDYVAIEDIGRILNPLIAHGQAVGAIVQGLGGALMEHLHMMSMGSCSRLL
jgi:CO/xanthine dehydrogenase Mo-binding subunit